MRTSPGYPPWRRGPERHPGAGRKGGKALSAKVGATAAAAASASRAVRTTHLRIPVDPLVKRERLGRHPRPGAAIFLVAPHVHGSVPRAGQVEAAAAGGAVAAGPPLEQGVGKLGLRERLACMGWIKITAGRWATWRTHDS